VRKRRNQQTKNLIVKEINKEEKNYRLMSRKRKNNTEIPDFEIDSLARALLPAIQKLFESEEGKREFEEWQAERQKSQLNKKQNKESR